MHTLWLDIRYALRLLKKSPGFTAAAVLTLALGIGANAAVFSVANAFLRKPIWFPEIERLAMVITDMPGNLVGRNSVTPADYLVWKAQSQSFEKIGAYEWNEVNLTGSGDPQKLTGANVTSNYFDILGTAPQMGRAFLPEEEQPGHDQEVILGYSLWVRQFGSDPAILGKKITVDGLGQTVVGVMGSDFAFPSAAQLWFPMTITDKEKSLRSSHYVWPVARLRPGVSIEQAQAEMSAIQGRLQTEFPAEEKNWNARVLPMVQFASDQYSRQYTLLLLVAVMFVLLIACANVASVQMSRATARRTEFAMREAIGASRSRIIRQLLTESTLLSLAGAALGLVLAKWALQMIVTSMPQDVVRYISAWKHIQLDGEALLFTTVIALGAGIAAGLAPAIQSSKLDLSEQLKEGARGSTGGRSRHFLRNALVVSEIAASLLLLIGAGLTVRGLRALLATHRTAVPETLLTMRVVLPDSKYKEKPQQRAFFEQVIQRLDAIPGVKAASVATGLPYGDTVSDSFRVEGIPQQPGEIRLAGINDVDPEFFHTMNIPLRDGRFFTPQDGPEAPRVVIISERMARRFWPNQSAIGKRVQQGAPKENDPSAKPWATVVGVVGDVRYQWFDREDFPTLYFPYQQAPRQYSYITVRSDGDPRRLIPAVRAGIAGVDPDQPIFEIKTLDRLISESVVGLSYVAVMMAVLGMIALVLAAVGVYGAMAYAVVERTHEFGVRLTLGAQPAEILQLVFSRGLYLLGAGLAIGLPISYGLARLLSSIIFGVSSTDAGIFSGITLFLAAIALAACYIPARRAMRVDPMVALRYE